jgi:hypothetical protein
VRRYRPPDTTRGGIREGIAFTVGFDDPVTVMPEHREDVEQRARGRTTLPHRPVATGAVPFRLSASPRPASRSCSVRVAVVRAADRMWEWQASSRCRACWPCHGVGFNKPTNQPTLYHTNRGAATFIL